MIARVSAPRVCAVSFLNTVPLVWGMLHGDERRCFDLSFSVPAECADRLDSGAADIGIVPSIEVARQGLSVIHGTGIACHGPVRSILLVTKVRPEHIRTIATDASSRSSVMLSRIVLARRYGARPELISMAPYLPAMLEAADAALIIGDPALRLAPAHLPYATFDLGGEWCEMTGLPMVFAVWACRPEFHADGLEEAFLSSYRYGMEHLDDIVRQEAAPRNLTTELAHEYLTHRIVFPLGDREYEGMRLFIKYAAEFDTVVASGGALAI